MLTSLGAYLIFSGASTVAFALLDYIEGLDGEKTDIIRFKNALKIAGINTEGVGVEEYITEEVDDSVKHIFKLNIDEDIVKVSEFINKNDQMEKRLKGHHIEFDIDEEDMAVLTYYKYPDDVMQIYRVFDKAKDVELGRYISSEVTNIDRTYIFQIPEGYDPDAYTQKAKALGIQMEGACKFDYDGKQLIIKLYTDEINQEMHYDRTKVTETLDEESKGGKDLCAFLGFSQQGHLVLNFKKIPHTLFGGSTGWGKTSGLRAILMSLIHYYHHTMLDISIIDFKAVDLNVFQVAPHVRDFIVDDFDALRKIKDLVLEMERRKMEFQKAGFMVNSVAKYNEVTGENLDYKLVIIDEYQDIKNSECGEYIEEDLFRLCTKARSYGIYVIVATQKPQKDVISTNIKSVLDNRISYVCDQNASKTILGHYGAEELPSVKGRGIYQIGTNGKEAKEFQSPWIEEDTLFDILKERVAELGIDLTERMAELGLNPDGSMTDDKIEFIREKKWERALRQLRSEYKEDLESKTKDLLIQEFGNPDKLKKDQLIESIMKQTNFDQMLEERKDDFGIID